MGASNYAIQRLMEGDRPESVAGARISENKRQDVPLFRNDPQNQKARLEGNRNRRKQEMTEDEELDGGETVSQARDPVTSSNSQWIRNARGT